METWNDFKKKFSFLKSLEELLIVIIGIALTLLGTHECTLHQDKKNMRHYLKVLKEELVENKKSVDKVMESLLSAKSQFSHYIFVTN